MNDQHQNSEEELVMQRDYRLLQVHEFPMKMLGTLLRRTSPFLYFPFPLRSSVFSSISSRG